MEQRKKRVISVKPFYISMSTLNHEKSIIQFTDVNQIVIITDNKSVDDCKRSDILQVPFGGDVSILLPMRSSAGTPGIAQKTGGAAARQPDG
jgi:hypothetical protein